MKKMTLLLILLILSIWINGLEIAYENNFIEISGNFKIKEFIIKTVAEEDFYQLIIVQCTNGGKIGEAEIPFCSKYVSLPDNGNFVINNLSFGFDEQTLDKKIVPAGWEDNLLPNKAFYQKNEWIPEEIIKISDPNIMSGFRFSQVTISPIQYNPALNKIRIIKNIQAELEVDFSINKNPITKIKSTFSKSFSKIVKENVLGAEDKRSVEDGLYLFIAPENCETNLQPLLRWKEKLGFKTRFAPISETGNSNINILNYLQNAYDNWEIPPEFVVLVGDVSGNIIVPSNYINYGSPYSPVNVTDHTYTLLEGDDYFPDIMIGRLSVQNQFQLQTIVSKITNYEGNPYMDENWFTEALMVGFIANGYWQMYSHRETLMLARQKLLDFTYTVVDTFIHPWQSGSSLLGQMINGGYTLINFRGAGSPYAWHSWTSGPMFEIWDIQNLTNGFMLPMVTSMTCGGGDFATSYYPSCFGETWLNEGSPSEPKGAIGFIGPSEHDTKTGWNNANSLGIYQGITRENLFRCSEMLLRGKMELYNNYPYCHGWGGPTNSDRFYFYVYNLLGDPGLAVWTDIPKVVTLTCDDEMIYGSNYLEVQVSTLASDNSDFIIAVTNEDSLIATGTTDFSGEAQIFLNLPIGDYEVTASKYGYIPKTEDLFVYEGDILSLTGYFFVEETIPGQLVNLQILIQNLGNTAVTNVPISLISEDIYLEVISGEIVASSIAAGDTFFGEFQFQIGNEWKNDYLTNLFVNVSSAFGDQSFMIPVEITSPELALSQFIVDNATGCLIQNETADVNIELLNCGNLESGEFDVNLISLNEKTEVIVSNGSYFNISVNGTGMNSNPFQVSVNNVITGELAKYMLEISHNGDFLQELIFTVPIGNIDEYSPTFSEYGYYAIESDDVGNFQAPVYNWIEIAPQYGGNGTLIGADHTTPDGYTKTIGLPFTFQYFGQYYNSISVNSNGYLSMCETDLVFFRNRNIPSGIGPDAMIAPFWDDLKNGQMYGYYDEDNHYFVIEWLDFQNTFNTYYDETFQVILYDPLYYPTPTGDGEILFQYQEVNNVDQNENYATVGIENEMQDSGLLMTFANIYDPTAKLLEDETVILFTTNGSEIIEPPVLVLNPLNFQFILMLGQTDIQTLDITNDGEVNLIYSIMKQYVDPRASGGPDEYGYIWVDSNELGGPSYSWRDISGLGTEVTFVNNDEGTPLMPIGFDFNYYGTDYSEFRINPNGWIGFGDDNTEWSNSSIPHPDAPKPAILGFWDDLNPLEGGNVYYYSTIDSLVVWFDDVIHYAGNYNGTYDFEMIIYPDGKILFQYRTVSGDIDTNTIGIQNELGDIGLEVVHNSTYVQNELALLFKKEVNWLDVDPASGLVASGETDYVNISVSTEELDIGEYTCDLIITSNDPNSSMITIPVDLTVVSQLPDIAVSADSLDFGIVYVGSDSTKILTISNQGSDPLIVSSISSDAAEFTVDITGFTLQPAQSQNVNVTFTPISDEFIFGILSIASNDPNNPSVEVSLSGQGLIPGVPNIAVSADSLDFGVVIIGSDSLKTLVITNIGDVTLTVTDIYTNTDEFSVNSTEFNLEPAENQVLEITFAPSYEGIILDTLTIISNDPDEPVYPVSLQGEGATLVNFGDGNIPLITGLGKNYPNPFNPETTINFALHEPAFTRIEIFNIKGQKIKTLINEFLEARNYQIIWNGTDENNQPVSSGIYFYKLEVDNQEISVKKCLLLK